MSVIVIAHYQSSELFGSSPPSQINMASVIVDQDNSNGYPKYWQNLGWSGNSEIPDHLAFSQHTKTNKPVIKHPNVQRF